MNEFYSMTDARPSCPPSCDPEARQPSQLLPAIAENGEIAVRANPATELLAALQHALTALPETEGISQVPDEDLMQTLTLVKRVLGRRATRDLNQHHDGQ